MSRLNILQTSWPNIRRIRICSNIRILGYLAGTKILGITYCKPKDDAKDKNLFHGFANAAYENKFDLKSTTGYIFKVAGGAINWKLRKQRIIALSSTKGRIRRAFEGIIRAVMVRKPVRRIGISQESSMIVKGDNERIYYT